MHKNQPENSRKPVKLFVFRGTKSLTWALTDGIVIYNSLHGRFLPYRIKALRRDRPNEGRRSQTECKNQISQLEKNKKQEEQ